jgi:hypothetical protein
MAHERELLDAQFTEETDSVFHWIVAKKTHETTFISRFRQTELTELLVGTVDLGGSYHVQPCFGNLCANGWP